MPQGLGLSLPRSRSSLHLLDDVIGLTALSIGRFCQPELAKSSFSEHWPLQFAWTVLLGEMLDVARFGQYGGKLHLLCQSWYVYSSWTKQNLPPDCQWISNSDANHTTWPGCYGHFHVISRGLFETKISRRPFPWSISYLCHAIRQFWRSYTAIYLCYQTLNIRATLCKFWGGGKPLQVGAILSRIHREHNSYVSCYLFHSDKMLTI